MAYFEREQRELVQLNYVDVVRSPLLAHSGEALGHVGYFAELIDEWAQEAHADERLFRLGASMVDAIAVGAPIDKLARYFGTGCCACRASTRRSRAPVARRRCCPGQ